MQNEFVRSVEEFMKLSGQLPHKREFNVRQTALQIGLQLEEMAEKLEAVYGFKTFFVEEMFRVSSHFKNGTCDKNIEISGRESLLDADVDLAWVTIGSMLSQGADVLGAIGEVTRANMDKFPNGVVTKDGNGKVKKPDGWKGPDLSGFVCKEIK